MSILQHHVFVKQTILEDLFAKNVVKKEDQNGMEQGWSLLHMDAINYKRDELFSLIKVK